MTTVEIQYEKRKVMYDGDNRDYLRGKVGTVVKVTRTAKSIILAVAYPDGSIEYGASWAWSMLPEENEVDAMAVLEPNDFDLEELFTKASGGPLAVAKAEIARLEARIAELKAAVKVIESL